MPESEFEYTKEQLEDLFNGGDGKPAGNADAMREILTSRPRDPEAERLAANAVRLCGNTRDQLERINIDALAAWNDHLQCVGDKCNLLSRKLQACKDPEGLSEEIGELCSELAQRLRIEQAAMADAFMRAGRLLKMISDKCELIG